MFPFVMNAARRQLQPGRLFRRRGFLARDHIGHIIYLDVCNIIDMYIYIYDK